MGSVLDTYPAPVSQRSASDQSQGGDQDTNLKRYPPDNLSLLGKQSTPDNILQVLNYFQAKLD